MVELDHQRSAANTLVNKMRLYIFVLFNICIYCRFASYSEFPFMGTRTASPRGRYGERPQRDSV